MQKENSTFKNSTLKQPVARAGNNSVLAGDGDSGLAPKVGRGAHLRGAAGPSAVFLAGPRAGGIKVQVPLMKAERFYLGTGCCRGKMKRDHHGHGYRGVTTVT